MITKAELRRCAELIASCSGMLITAGAGMGVDSGLPDFRGNGGFWEAYPALGNAGIDFTEIANPKAFSRRPELAWGFYAHRLRLYRETRPHEGFQILKEIGEQLPDGCFVFTTNVDGQFQKAGFDAERIHENHGSIHWMQCSRPCSGRIWSADGFESEVDVATCTLISPLPRCPNCGSIARPSILMFDDIHWLSARSEFQSERLAKWRQTASRLATIELGAGTVSWSARRAADCWGYPVIRVNPTAPEVGKSTDIGVAMGARDFLRLLAEELSAFNNG